MGQLQLLNGLLLQEPQIERPEHQDNSDVHYQPLPEPVPEEQDVHADHDGYQREHVKHDGCLSSHPSFLLRAAEFATAARMPRQATETGLGASPAAPPPSNSRHFACRPITGLAIA